MMHAENTENNQHDDSAAPIGELRDSTTALCFDEGFAAEEQDNLSAIASEYFNRLPPGSLGLMLVQEAAESERIVVLPKTVTALPAPFVGPAVMKSAVFLPGCLFRLAA